jgi:hypothetical protein
MPKIAISMMSDSGFALVYLGSVATLCVALDRALAGRVELLRTAHLRAVTALFRVSHGIPQATAALALGGVTIRLLSW